MHDRYTRIADASLPSRERGAQVFHDRVVEHTEAGAAAAGDAVVAFEGVAVLHPRGRFDIEMYASFLKLLGQARARRPRPRATVVVTA